ncbi:MAG: glutamate-1-semialdehyde aminotransferase [Bdellovibrionales bacterium GWA2_49_15]|nr:MAG: glutamate-1-semialdehyde aminotransferase [Bdellovibrionales bacterium GWA2_49_15]HAZ12690.1 aspartate aminotransferase family protein [Bdellovibrionales bacterium]
MSTSLELFEKAKKLVPGGVHSPVRSFKGLHRGPIFFERGEDAYLYDVEGKSYIDFCMSFGPLLLGHANKKVHATLTEALKRGWSFGAAEPYSLELADFLLSRLPFVEQIRFMNSGTEAVMTALRLARGFTGRDKIIKFNGCYHGHTDSMLIKAGSGLAAEPSASSAGVPAGIAQDTIVLELDSEQEVEQAFARYGRQIAAVIVEPLPANNGLLIQRKEFLQLLRKITKAHDSLLIFDEVISGFRVAFGGMAALTGITPDIVTYGKVIGGGLPVGAVCGPRHIMEKLAPIGPVYQAGTLSANPLAMAGGLATLKELTATSYETLEQNTKAIKVIFDDWFARYENGRFSKCSFIHFGSLFWIMPQTKGTIRKLDDIPSNLSDSFKGLFEVLLNKGVYLAPNAYEVGFVSLAHDANVQQELKKRLWS